jgi:hypothetical protein
MLPCVSGYEKGFLPELSVSQLCYWITGHIIMSTNELDVFINRHKQKNYKKLEINGTKKWK